MIRRDKYAIVTKEGQGEVQIYDNIDKKVIKSVNFGNRLIGLASFHQILNGCAVVKEDNHTKLINLETSKQVTISQGPYLNPLDHPESLI